MRLKAFTAIILGLAGCGVVAIVQAQDSAPPPLSDPAPGETEAQSTADAGKTDPAAAGNSGAADLALEAAQASSVGSSTSIYSVRSAAAVEQVPSASPTRRSTTLEQRLQRIRISAPDEDDVNSLRTDESRSPSALVVGEPRTLRPPRTLDSSSSILSPTVGTGITPVNSTLPGDAPQSSRRRAQRNSPNQATDSPSTSSPAADLFNRDSRRSLPSRAAVDSVTPQNSASNRPQAVSGSPATSLKVSDSLTPMPTPANQENSIADRPLEPTADSDPEGELPSGDGAEDQLFSTRGAVLNVGTAGPRTVVIGKDAVYTIRVQNMGNSDAKDVIVVASMPGWTDVIATETSAGRAHSEAVEGGEGRIAWSIDRVAANQYEVLQLTLVARENRPFQLGVGWTFKPVSAQAQIVVQEPKLEMSLSGPTDILFGETKMFTVDVDNPGTGSAENVVVHLLPVAADGGLAGTKQLGTLEAGERRQMKIELVAEQAGRLQIRAQAFADGGLRTEANAEVMVRRGQIELELRAPEIKYAGTAATYELQVVNTGDAIAEDVTLEAQLPLGSDYVARYGEGELDESGRQVTWSIGALRPGAVKELEFQCVLGSAGANQLEITARANSGLIARDTAITLVEALADLKLTVNDPQGPVPVGEESAYEIRVTNRGTKAAEDVRVFAFFSEGIEPVGIEGGRAKVETGQVIFQPINRLEAGQELQLQIRARADVEGNHIFRVEVECADLGTELAAQETTRFYGTSAAPGIVRPADVRR